MKTIIMNKKPWAPHPALIAVVSILFLGLMSFVIVVRSENQANQARVNQVEGILVFTDSRPIQSYELLGTVKTGLVLGSAQYRPLRDHLLKKLKKDFPAANGAILNFTSSGDYAEAIKLQE